MFNLIVAVISIALIAAMAAASIFYGGSAFSSGTAEAQATTLINNGQQISGAQQLHMIDNSGNRATAIATLVTDEYLQAVPTPPSVTGGFDPLWEVTAAGELATIQFGDGGVAARICEEIADQGGVNDSDGAVQDGLTAVGDITVAMLVDGTDAVQYGCFAVDSGTGDDVAFAFKL